jgi:hypothetical protein
VSIIVPLFVPLSFLLVGYKPGGVGFVYLGCTGCFCFVLFCFIALSLSLSRLCSKGEEIGDNYKLRLLFLFTFVLFLGLFVSGEELQFCFVCSEKRVLSFFRLLVLFRSLEAAQGNSRTSP